MSLWRKPFRRSEITGVWAHPDAHYRVTQCSNPSTEWRRTHRANPPCGDVLRASPEEAGFRSAPVPHPSHGLHNAAPCAHSQGGVMPVHIVSPNWVSSGCLSQTPNHNQLRFTQLLSDRTVMLSISRWTINTSSCSRAREQAFRWPKHRKCGCIRLTQTAQLYDSAMTGRR
jgi:hypothetical protein